VPVSSTGGVDAAYILATPEQIAYIKPMIALRNGSQSGVTLYASSRSAQGLPARTSVWRWKAAI
jgi:outer membrane PBP1 activator LpoA protein